MINLTPFLTSKNHQIYLFCVALRRKLNYGTRMRYSRLDIYRQCETHLRLVIVTLINCDEYLRQFFKYKLKIKFRM